MHKEMFLNIKGLKTRSGAVQRVIKFSDRYANSTTISYIIAERDGKFIPIIRLREDQSYLMRLAVDNGLCVC